MSAWEGSKMQEAAEAERDRRNGLREPKPWAEIGKLGERRITVKLSAEEIRRVVGAPPGAVVEFDPGVNTGRPDGPEREGSVTVAWREERKS